jgi:hypothetical protein
MSWAEIGRMTSAKAAAAYGLALAALLAAPASALALGSLSGTVTAAVGGQPLEGIEVCAESVGVTDVRECVATGGDGKYQVAGLEPANYTVEFRPSVVSGFLSQRYKDSFGAELVHVVNAADIFGIDAALQKEAPAAGGGGGAVPPAGSGGSDAPVAPTPPAAVPLVVGAPKPGPKTCRKGWRKLRVKGKAVCRKVQRKGPVARPRER